MFSSSVKCPLLEDSVHTLSPNGVVVIVTGPPCQDFRATVEAVWVAL